MCQVSCKMLGDGKVDTSNWNGKYNFLLLLHRGPVCLVIFEIYTRPLEPYTEEF